MRGQCETPVRVDELEIEVFDRNQGMLLRQFPGEFVPVIIALIGDLLMQAGHLPVGFKAGRLVPGFLVGSKIAAVKRVE